MKKLGFILFLSVLLFSNTAKSADFAGKCPTEPYEICNSFSRGLQRYSGLNFFSSFLTKEIAEMNVSKLLKSKKTNLKIDIYSTGDFVSGKLRNFSANIKDFSVEDFYITEIKAKSLCGFTDIDYKKAPPKTKTPMVIEFSSTLAEKDLHKTFASKKYSDLLANIPLTIDKTEVGILKINSLNTKIKNNKLFLFSDIQYDAGFLRLKFPIAFESSVEAKNNSIYLVNFKLSPEMFGRDFQYISDFTKLSRIKIIDLNTVKSDPYHIWIKKIAIQNGKIKTDGMVYIPENSVFK
ncbi:MAG: hypothetical protein A2Y25_09205 [Candidatus Melainabacteria bacterium GWF2_37_15]|nr:MAG: hypothetical protein A2Y25_09205 [Candidatus Melainabacteria bacterium GWF2_37_15]